MINKRQRGNPIEGQGVKPRGFRRDRDCFNCRAEPKGVKCDLNRPFCGPCLAADVQCRGYPNRIRWAQDRGTNGSELTSLSLPLVDTGEKCSGILKAGEEDDADVNWTTHYDKYLDFITTKFALARASLGQCKESKDTLADVWQLVWHRTSISGQLQPGDNLDAESLAMQSAALRGLNAALKKDEITAIFGIVTFAFLDVYEAPFGDWKRHLLGARALLDLHCTDRTGLQGLYQRVPGLRQAVSLLMWYDVMGAFLTMNDLLIFEEWHRVDMDENLFQLVHCPRSAFELAILVMQARAVGQKGHSLHLQITKQLLLCQNTDHQTRPAPLLQDAWRYGIVMAAINLDRSSDNQELDETMCLLAERICQAVKATPPNSGRYRHLAGPIMLLGANSRLPRCAEVVDSYWMTCSSLRPPIYPKGFQPGKHWSTMWGEDNGG
ncbi:Ff.00g055010.m01.CDS01 [Fusarium sp. VM40]|nr:Ff.00g055010.m01.CDS01 [Fusarium sp. VM40]